MKQVSIIIPCYNEKNRILSVVKGVLGSDLVREVIVVDDGSEKETAEILKTLPRDVLVLKHEKNKGKAEAMKTGLLAATGEVVVFVDADLCGFTADHLKLLCEPVLLGKCDMSIGVRELDVLYARMFKLSAAFGGERAFVRKNLLKNVVLFRSGGYLIEADFNKYYLKKGRVQKVFLKGVGQASKLKKIGLVSGIIKSVQMSLEIINHLGLREFFNQISTVNRLQYDK
jgi:glycosyltransferase involved in cell wall biosynthesis